MARDYETFFKSPIANGHVVRRLRPEPSIEVDPRSAAARRRPISLSQGIGGILTHWRPKLPDISTKPAADCRWPVNCNCKREPERSYCKDHSRLAYQGGASSKVKGAEMTGGFAMRSMASWLK